MAKRNGRKTVYSIIGGITVTWTLSLAFAWDCSERYATERIFNEISDTTHVTFLAAEVDTLGSPDLRIWRQPEHSQVFIALPEPYDVVQETSWVSMPLFVPDTIPFFETHIVFDTVNVPMPFMVAVNETTWLALPALSPPPPRTIGWHTDSKDRRP